MNNTFKLVFDKSITCIAGYEYGEEVFKKQVMNNISYDDTITIIFPERIVKVASSFIQGLFKEIINNIGYEGVEKKVIIKTGSEELTKQMMDRIK
jgi:hypothetical protein